MDFKRRNTSSRSGHYGRHEVDLNESKGENMLRAIALIGFIFLLVYSSARLTESSHRADAALPHWGTSRITTPPYRFNIAQGPIIDGPTSLTGTSMFIAVVAQSHGYERHMFVSPDFKVPADRQVRYQNIQLRNEGAPGTVIYWVLPPTETALPSEVKRDQ